MKYVRRLVPRKHLRDALAVSQIAVCKTEIWQVPKRRGTVLEIRSDHTPALFMKELDQVRPNKSLCARNQCNLSHGQLSVPAGLGEDLAHATKERTPLLLPGVCQVNLLALVCDLH